MNQSLPIIDMSGLAAGAPGALEAVAHEIGKAAREVGFFYLTGHGIDPALIERGFPRIGAFLRAAGGGQGEAVDQAARRTIAATWR